MSYEEHCNFERNGYEITMMRQLPPLEALGSLQAGIICRLDPAIVIMFYFVTVISQIDLNFFRISLAFEEAYCLYRLNKTTEALEILIGIENLSLKEKELLAQVVQ